ncbi:MAG: PASTA domain-containing protein [Candidatus Caldatribacteriota bacterium]|nr:PASTA domain-containing protein [Candidatus Caldatribacteriota bacterium]
MVIKKIFYSIFGSIASIFLILFIITAGGLSALLLFQNIFSVSDTTVPSVINDNIETAQRKIYASGLKIVISGEEFNNQIPKNIIIRQSPNQGTIIKQNREVKVVISKGKKLVSVTIPDLKNKQLKEAVSIIKEYNLILGRVTYTNHFSAAKDTVIAQVPESGNRAVENKKINLLVSKGNY